MTEPVARAVPVRRTVRVAMALVAGQAALCAVIGWFMFGSAHTGPKPPDPVDPRAAAPTAIPAVSVRLPSASPAPTPAAERTTAAPSVMRSFRAPEPPERPEPPAVDEDRGGPTPAGDEESPSTVISRGPTASTTRPAPGPDQVSGSPTPAATTTPDHAVPGQPCPDEGAPGVTADDIVVHCVPDADGTLRWQIT